MWPYVFAARLQPIATLYVTFVYCVETAKDGAIVAMKVEYMKQYQRFQWHHFQ